MDVSTISGINNLSKQEKREIYTRLIPPELLDHFQLSPYLVDTEGNDLLHLDCPPGSLAAEISLYHQSRFPDPILYGHLTDNVNGQVHVLLYVVNNPDSQRFMVDCMPDGTPTQFGTAQRNLEAETAAMQDGLAPGQIRRGLGMLSASIRAFEVFVESLDHQLFYNEPLYYHNAVIFERYGFTYQAGRKLLDRIHDGFAPGGDLLPLLDGSTPFRQPEAADSIRLRSWAIHDGILGQPFTDVTMYKMLGKNFGISTTGELPW